MVAAIASIEIPNKDWEELVPMLAQNSLHDDLNVMKASLQTLAYILEELSPDDLDDQRVQEILSAAIQSMAKP